MKALQFITKYTSTISNTIVYLITIVLFLIMEGFVYETQIGLLPLFAVLIFMGLLLDLTIKKNTLLTQGQKMFTQLLTLTPIIILGLVLLLEFTGRSVSATTQYFMYIGFGLPFAIAGYHPARNGKKLISTIIAVVLVFTVYLYLTTISDSLVTGNGLFLYLLSFAIAFYCISSIDKFPYLNIILGAIVGALLFYLYKSPIDSKSTLYGWDYSFMIYFEYLLVIALILGATISLIGAYINKPLPAPKRRQSGQKN